ncbi:MAG: hypothetical protein M3P49_08055, partial [Actinomycetota bacterium]|nr:hypothetical protein [Actinomycetota bacterium]
MERRFVPYSWVGKKVGIMPIGDRDEPLPTRIGWLKGVNDEGIEFSDQFYSDSLERLMPTKADFYPWSRLG